MVVDLYMVSVVGHSLLLQAMFFLLSIGVLVLLYIASYYDYRGGASYGGVDCGIFFIGLGNSLGTSWVYGTALSFYIYTLYCTWWLL